MKTKSTTRLVTLGNVRRDTRAIHVVGVPEITNPLLNQRS